MSLKRQELSKILYPDSRGRRFTQDTPIQLPVWLAYVGEDNVPPVNRKADLLLEPHSSTTVHVAVQTLKQRLAEERQKTPEELTLPYNESHILAKVTFRELLRAVLPLTSWWNSDILSRFTPDPEQLRQLPQRKDFLQLLLNPAYQDPNGILPSELLDFIRIAGAIALNRPMPETERELLDYFTEAVNALAELLSGADLANKQKNPPVLFQASLNRNASPSVWRSRLAVKADAAVLLFSIRCNGLIWAVVDSGIDARHPAFRSTDMDKPAALDDSEWSRVRRTFDFTRIRELLGGEFDALAENSVFASLPEAHRTQIQSDLRRRLNTGQQVDWDLLRPFLEVKHGASYPAPEHEHGTHVAGILAANQPNSPPREQDLIGMCPDLDLYDVRVIDKNGQGDEFSILAALQFIRFLNSHADRLLVQGVNLSFSIPHAVDSYACGETPVCQECRRLVGSGVVVVAAAGNRGYRGSLGRASGADAAIADAFEDYRNISITDPGNAEEVITVGSTHRFQPHKYGVSYFSSRGPTGDGRAKPDIVAPGEKVESCTPGKRKAALDGTSMAAPHVSGASALLMARHRELIGRPARIKEILCKSATDLGRERAFQGAGMLDVLRALQLV
jgi:serine protease AprX